MTRVRHQTVLGPWGTLASQPSAVGVPRRLCRAAPHPAVWSPAHLSSPRTPRVASAHPRARYSLVSHSSGPLRRSNAVRARAGLESDSRALLAGALVVAVARGEDGERSLESRVVYGRSQAAECGGRAALLMLAEGETRGLSNSGARAPAATFSLRGPFLIPSASRTLLRACRFHTEPLQPFLPLLASPPESENGPLVPIAIRRNRARPAMEDRPGQATFLSFYLRLAPASPLALNLPTPHTLPRPKPAVPRDLDSTRPGGAPSSAPNSP